MADSQFWRDLAFSFRQVLASCHKPLNVEWRSHKPTPVPECGDASAICGDGGGPNCFIPFSQLAHKAAQKLTPSHPNKGESWLNILAAHSRPVKPRDGKRGTDIRLEDVVRLSAEHCDRLADAEQENEFPFFTGSAIPNFRYFPTHLWEKQGPKQWSRFRFLQACERLNIPSDLWPKFTGLELPSEQDFPYTTRDTLSVPPFHPLYQSEAEWRQRSQQLFDKFLDMHAAKFKAWFKEELDKGTVTKVKTTRDTSPLDLRYEWAARRYCLREPYKTMCTDEWSADRIRKVVARTFAEIGLNDRK